MSARTDRIEALYDFAVGKPEGFTNAEAMASLGWNLQTFNAAARGVRELLSNDSITLTCNSNGLREKWTYHLVSQAEDGGFWVTNRLRDSESRFKTLAAVTGALVNATDGRTIDGRKARIMHKAISRLSEDLTDLSDLDGD